MRLRRKRNRESGLPPELHSSYRAVRLSAAGLFAVFAVVAMLGAAVSLPVLLYPRLADPAPVWLVFLIPPVLVAAAGVLGLLIRRQARLLSEGRPALATVLTAEKRRGSSGEHVWRVEYEWTLLSGAKRRARFDAEKKDAPAPGKTIPIIYDRDNPHRHARYPLALVRLRPR